MEYLINRNLFQNQVMTYIARQEDVRCSNYWRNRFLTSLQMIKKIFRQGHCKHIFHLSVGEKNGTSRELNLRNNWYFLRAYDLSELIKHSLKQQYFSLHGTSCTVIASSFWSSKLQCSRWDFQECCPPLAHAGVNESFFFHIDIYG